MAKAYQEFQARAFNSLLGNEALEGTVYFVRDSLTFSDGQTTVSFPNPRLSATYEDVGEGRIIFRDALQPDWTIVTSELDVLQFTSVPEIARLAEQFTSRETRRELSRRGKLVVMFVAGAALVLWLGMLATGAMVRAIVAKVPFEKEREFGSGLLAELKEELDFADDTNGVEQLTSMAEPLLRALPKGPQWQFHLLNEAMPNAFALPGGHIVVTTGLVAIVERPEELLAVVAHEVAHVTEKHGFRQAIASAGPFLVFQIFLGGRGGALAAVAGGSAFLLVHQSFSQEYEKDADDVGWDYLVKANIDPRGMIEIFRKLKAAEAGEPTGEMVPEAFHSHPDLDKRIARLEKKWKKLGRKSGFVELKE